jgi:short-subunit dehydrogenase
MAATYTGAASLLLHLAPVLEAQGEGRVVVIGSVAGDRGRLKNYVYGSAKAGLHAFAQGLRARLFRAGVQVTTVKPGFIDTAMTFGMRTGPLMASPEACARACLRLAASGREVAYYPPVWRLIMLIIKLIPEGVMKKMSF